MILRRTWLAAIPLALPALAFRCPTWHRDAVRLLRRLNGGDDFFDERALRHDVLTRTVALAPILLHEFCPNYDTLKDDVEVKARVGAAVDVDDMARLASPWHADVFRIWRPFADCARAPRLVPRPVRSVTDDDDAAVTLWRSVLRLPIMGLREANWLAPLVALAPIEALVPGDVVDAGWKLSAGVDFIKGVLPGILRGQLAKTTTTAAAPQPVRAEKKPAPNGPCPCGSGRKFKKCHGKA